MFGRAKTDDWEEAYRELVTELEAKERAWSQLESDLRHAAAQLGTAAMGQSDAIDAALESILDRVRSGEDGLEADLERLETELRRAEKLEPRNGNARGARKTRPDPSRIARPPVDHDDAADATTPARARDPAPPAEIGIIIDALAERLRKIRELEAVAEHIARRPRGAANEDWSATLNELADGIAQAVSSLRAERIELESFLETVTAQLSQFEQWTQWHLADARLRQRDSNDLEAIVNRQMRDIQDEMQDTHELEDLKQKVQRRLRAVADRFRAFRESEAQRLDESERRNHELASEVSRLRQETATLSELCGDQQDRLMHDALTRVHSRYAYEERLLEEYRRWQRDKRPIAYALWDIDKFKSINDTYGHDAGDRLLRLIGAIIQRHKRGEDFVARIGGEEFALLLPTTDAAGALAIAERVREAIASTPFNYRGTRENVTISCGVTEFRADDTPLSVYQRADKALYQAKEAGRNRCVSI